MKRKIISILLLFALAAPILVVWHVMQVQRRQVRRDVKHRIVRGIPKSKLEYLGFARENLDKLVRWKHSKEFEYQQKLFDIVERHETSDSVYFWCWVDTKETKLGHAFKKLLNEAMGQNPVRKDNQKRLSQFFKSLYWQKVPAMVHFTGQQTIRLQLHHLFYTSIKLSPPSPPPGRLNFSQAVKLQFLHILKSNN